jgi:Tol biopolymer transport system component
MWSRISVALSVLVFTCLFGMSPNGAYGHCAGKHTGNHPHCSDDDGGDPPTTSNPVIVYTKIGKGKNRELVVTEADGSNPITVLTFSSAEEIDQASWSADGTELVFDGVIDGDRGIYRLSLFDANGNIAPAPPQLITQVNSSSISRLSWSPVPAPDGNHWIAYKDTDPAGSLNDDIFLVNPDTGVKINLTASTEYAELDPTWSPDGTRIAIVSTPADQSNSPRDVVILDLIIDSDTGLLSIDKQTSLIQLNLDSSVDHLKDHEWRWLDWANTSEAIVLVNTADRQVWVLPTDPALVASDAAQLTDDSSDVSRSRPGWSPDDTQLIYDRSGIGGVCNLGTREKRKVVIADLDNPAMPSSLEICNGAELGEGRLPDWWRSDSN